MSATETKALITQSVERLQAEMPALKQLKIVVELELRGRGDVQIYRVELPGPQISKQVPEDAKVVVSLMRTTFNELAKDGKLTDWQRAFKLGNATASGQTQIIKLIQKVATMQLERDHARKARRSS